MGKVVPLIPIVPGHEDLTPQGRKEVRALLRKIAEAYQRIAPHFEHPDDDRSPRIITYEP